MIFVNINSPFLSAVRLAHWHWDAVNKRFWIVQLAFDQLFCLKLILFIFTCCFHFSSSICPSIHLLKCSVCLFFYLCDSLCYEWYMEWVTTDSVAPWQRVRKKQLLTITILLYYSVISLPICLQTIFLRSTVCWLGIITDVALLDFQDWTFMRICIGSGRGKDWKGGSYRRPWRVTLGTLLCWRFVPIIYVMDWGMYTPGPYLAQGKTLYYRG